MGGKFCSKMETGNLLKKISSSWKKMEQNINDTVTKSKVGKYFKLEARKSTFTIELRAGSATFLTMAYIISINATILSDSGGLCSFKDCSFVPLNRTDVGHHDDCVFKSNVGYQNCLEKTKRDLITATVLSAMIGSFFMGVLANLPLGLAPAMGPNAYIAYTLVGFHGSGSISYETAMAVVFVESCAFLVIAAIGLRSKLARLIPRSVRISCAAGIGLFIAFVGMQVHEGLGLIGPDKSSLVSLAACSEIDSNTGACISGKMSSSTFWLGSVGFLITCYGLMKDIKGSMVYGIVFVTLISWIRGTNVTYFPNTPLGDSNYNYFKKVIDFHKIQSTAGAISFSNFNQSQVWVALVTMLYVDVLATTGILYTMADMGGFVNENGDFEGQYMAFIVDGGTSLIASLLGSSPIATYIESSAGIREGGKTGLTAIVVSFYFLLSLFFAPLFTSVPPWAIGPSLIIVGILMMKVVKEINWEDIKEAVPAFMTMVLMPLTYNIANGIVAGIGLHIALNLYDYVVKIVRWFVKMRKMVVTEQNQVSATANLDHGIEVVAVSSV